MIKTLYVKYGSRMTTGTSEILYDYLLADDEMAPFFANVDVEAVRVHMSDLLGSLTGGPEVYRGRPLGEAHAGFDISPNHFKKLINYLSRSMTEAGISDEDKALVLAELEGRSSEITEKAS